MPVPMILPHICLAPAARKPASRLVLPDSGENLTERSVSYL
jgi:hypothetical protein